MLLAFWQQISQEFQFTGIEIGYIIAFLVGFVYAIFSGILSGVLSGVEGPDVDGVDIDSDISDGAHASFFSPMVVAMFISSFGGVGFLFKRLVSPSFYIHFPAALFSGIIIAYISFILLRKLFNATQESSQSISVDVVSSEAEIITPIPENGMGEIAYISKGTRYNGMARSIDGHAMERGCIVKIIKIVGNTYYVEKEST